MSQSRLSLQDAVINVNGRKMIGADSIANLFSLDQKMVRSLLTSYAKRPGRQTDVYADGGLVFTTGQGIVELSRIFPGDMDLEGLGKLAVALGADPALTQFDTTSAKTEEGLS